MAALPKHCYRCRAQFDPEIWLRDAHRPHGYGNRCRPCQRALQADQQQRRATARAETRRKWDRESPLRRRGDKDRDARTVTPVWADRITMRRLYTTANWLRGLGVDVQVDHIVPIRGREVCGLHTDANLALAFRRPNLGKGNRHDHHGHAPVDGQFRLCTAFGPPAGDR